MSATKDFKNYRLQLKKYGDTKVMNKWIAALVEYFGDTPSQSSSTSSIGCGENQQSSETINQTAIAGEVLSNVKSRSIE
jgi:hypothetical protein